MNLKQIFLNTHEILVTAFKKWLNDYPFKMAAALSFYSLISLAPLMIIITAIAGFIFGEKAATGQLITGMEEYVGTPTAKFIQNVLSRASVDHSELIAAAIGIVIFIWASLAVFVEIRDSLNLIWGIEVKPGKSIRDFFAGRLFALLILLFTGLLFILSLFAGAMLNIVHNYLPDFLNDIIPLLHWLDLIVSFAIVTILFAIVLKYLPSIKIEWKFVFVGALITSVLFNLGKIFIGYYLINSKYSTVYGAAGSLVILLLWVYYSGLIFFFGAELTQVIRTKFASKPLIVSKHVEKSSRING